MHIWTLDPHVIVLQARSILKRTSHRNRKVTSFNSTFSVQINIGIGTLRSSVKGLRLRHTAKLQVLVYT